MTAAMVPICVYAAFSCSVIVTSSLKSACAQILPVEAVGVLRRRVDGRPGYDFSTAAGAEVEPLEAVGVSYEGWRR